MSRCYLCPRKCGTDRSVNKGYCGCTDRIRAAKAYLHKWEEPCISGTRGSGTIFFSGCPLKCVYCQNYEISCEMKGKDITVQRLAEIIKETADKGAHNINFVTGTHYVPQIIAALDICKKDIHIPIVFNCGGYELDSTLEMLRGYVDIFIPDFKYFDPQIALKYSNTPDYFEYASKAVRKMAEMTGEPQFDDNGIMKKGVIVRHMIIPHCRHDSEKILNSLSDMKDVILLSLMSQYTPFYKAKGYKELTHRLSTYEYEKVLDTAQALGFKGYMQERTSAKEEYTPDFDLCGI